MDARGSCHVRLDSGGTGKVHDWSISRRIVAAVPLPVFLAGGLTPENVGEAIRTVRPFGVDLCTGAASVTPWRCTGADPALPSRPRS